MGDNHMFGAAERIFSAIPQDLLLPCRLSSRESQQGVPGWNDEDPFLTSQAACWQSFDSCQWWCQSWTIHDGGGSAVGCGLTLTPELRVLGDFLRPAGNPQTTLAALRGESELCATTGTVGVKSRTKEDTDAIVAGIACLFSGICSKRTGWT